MASLRQQADDKNIDGGYAWVILGAVFLLIFLMNGVRFSYGILYIQFLDAFDRGKGDTAWIGSLMFGMVSAAAPLGGALINHYGCRVTSILGSVIAASGFLLSYFSESIYFLSFCFGILGGTGFALIQMTTQVCLVYYFKRRRSFAVGISLCGAGVGGFIFNAVLKNLIEMYAWRGTILILSGIMLNGVVIGTLLRPNVLVSKTCNSDTSGGSEETYLQATSNGFLEQDRIMTKTDSETFSQVNGHSSNDDHYIFQNCHAQEVRLIHISSSAERDDSERLKNDQEIETKEPEVFNNCGWSWRMCGNWGRILDKKIRFSLLKDPSFAVFAMAQLFLASPYMIPFTFLPKAAVETGSSSQDVVWLMSALSISNTAFGLCVGVMANCKGANRMLMYTISVFFDGLLCLLFPVFQSYGFLMMYSILYGMSIGAGLVLVQVVIPELFGDDVIASSFGICILFRAPGNFIGPPLAGWTADTTGHLYMAFVVAGLMFLVGACLITIVLVFRQYRKTRSLR